MVRELFYQFKHTKLAALQWRPATAGPLNVLALHGWLDNAASFTELAPQLEDVTVTALDLAGHGLSQHRPDGAFYHLWDYVLDVADLLQQQKQSVWLVGHSMGGSVAMLVAAIVPEKVRGLILLDTIGPLTDEPQNRVATLQRAVQRMLKFRQSATPYASQEQMISARMDGFTKLNHRAASALVHRGAIQLEANWQWRHDGKLTFPSPYRMDEQSVTAFIEKIACPTLLLMANTGIYSHQRDQVERRAKHFSWVKLKWLDGGHHFHLETETSSAVAEEIKRFMDQN